MKNIVHPAATIYTCPRHSTYNTAAPALIAGLQQVCSFQQTTDDSFWLSSFGPVVLVRCNQEQSRPQSHTRDYSRLLKHSWWPTNFTGDQSSVSCKPTHSRKSYYTDSGHPTTRRLRGTCFVQHFPKLVFSGEMLRNGSAAGNEVPKFVFSEKC